MFVPDIFSACVPNSYSTCVICKFRSSRPAVLYKDKFFKNLKEKTRGEILF